jgi:hypothetical protein
MLQKCYRTLAVRRMPHEPLCAYERGDVAGMTKLQRLSFSRFEPAL